MVAGGAHVIRFVAHAEGRLGGQQDSITPPRDDLAQNVLGLAVARQGRWEEAAALLDEGLSLARVLGYPHGEALTLQALSELYADSGESQTARERLE